MKISHEIPKQLFDAHREINDYPYVLAHLLMEGSQFFDHEYADFYKRTLPNYEFSILDNSLFELGYPVEKEVLHKLAQEYKPSHLIVPDHLRDADKTFESFNEYVSVYGQPLSYNLIGVIQGKDFDASVKLCENYLTSGACDIIAIPYNCESDYDVTSRPRLVDFLISNFGSNALQNRIHLLGCLNPLEYKLYSSEALLTIHSTDTSCPIVTGWNGIPLHDYGYKGDKPKEKLAENLDISLSGGQINLIKQNISIFRSYVSR